MGTNSIFCCLIKSFYKYTIYNTYSKYIDIDTIKDNKELLTIYKCLGLFHEKFPEKDIQSTSDLELFFRSQYPILNHRDTSTYEALFKVLNELVVDPELCSAYLDAHRERQEGHRLALLGLEVSQGQKPWKDAVIEFKSILEGVPSEAAGKTQFVSQSLQDIYKEQKLEQGLRWPLKILNQILGSLRKGDYGIVFARPETGKTSFLAHIATHMASQAKGPVLWFNNEQAGSVVQSYCYRAALGLTSKQLYVTIEENEKRYMEFTKGNLWIYDSASIYKREVESICSAYDPSLIVFDQIDKIKGFEEDRSDLELGAIYQWARELAKRHCPTIGVCQAGESGANKRWLTMEDMVNAKTSKQAEADWILGIGQVNQEGYEKVRFFNVNKNKLIGDSDSVPEMRHGKAEVLFFPDRAQYKDIK